MKQEDGIPYGTREEVEAVYARIEEIANSGDKKLAKRTFDRGEYNGDLKALRSLYKEWGLKGVSVTRAKGAQCYWPVIRVPRVRREDQSRATYQADWEAQDDAVRLLEEATLRVYPDFSTIFSDNIYQDYCVIRSSFS